MKKLQNFREQIKDFVENHQKLIIGISAGIILFFLIIFNIGLIQISYYKMTGDTKKIINVLSKEVKDAKNHQRMYFKNAIDYLTQDMSETSMEFFEKYFGYLSSSDKEEVLSAYNQKEAFFQSQKAIFDDVARGNKSEAINKYINRLDMNKFELSLIEYFGADIEFTQDVVGKLYNIASMYQTKLPMDKFIISIYELMQFPELVAEDSIALNLLDVIDPKAIHRVLFTELKTLPIEVDLLNTWIDILNRKQVISTGEYAGFTNSYSNIKQIRDQYTQLERQEVDIKNVKEKIDVATSENESKIAKLSSEIEVVQTEVSGKSLELSNMKTYKSVELYIMDYYEDGHYEASIPEKSWFFGTYKPSNQKVKIKLTTSKPDSQGVFTFDVYYQGETKEGTPYYVEVSKEDREKIVAVENEIAQKKSLAGQKETEKAKLQAEVDNIRKANNYDQNNSLLEQVRYKKENILLRLKEKQVEIQTLFGIGNVIVDINKK